MTFILTAAAGFLRPLKAFAGSASVSLSADNTECLVGDIITVTLTVEADVEIGEVNCYVNFDDSKVTFRRIGDQSHCAGGDGGPVVVSEIDTNKTKADYLMKFIALAPGTVHFEAEVNHLDDADGTSLSYSKTNCYVTISATPDASSDATLKSLRVSPGVLSPAFSPEIFEYSTTVSKDIDVIYVSAIQNDEKAKSVQITGYDKLFPGRNEVHIIVTAENGTILDYKINVYKFDTTNQPTPTPTGEPSATEAPKPTETPVQHNLTVTKADDKLFLNGDFSFEIETNPDSVEVPKGFLRTKLVIDGESIVVFAPVDDSMNDFVLIPLKYNGGATALYRYDRVEKTLQRYVPKDITIHDETQKGVDEATVNELTNAYENLVKKISIWFAVASILWLVTLLILFYVLKNRKRRRK